MLSAVHIPSYHLQWEGILDITLEYLEEKIVIEVLLQHPS